MNNLIIEVESHDKSLLIRRLNRLKSVDNATDLGEYHFGGPTGYHKIQVTTTKTLAQVEQWLYDFSVCDYVGVVEA